MKMNSLQVNRIIRAINSITTAIYFVAVMIAVMIASLFLAIKLI